MRQVFVARDLTEAHLIRGLLESHGVSVTVRGEDLQGLNGEVPFPYACPSVWILDDGLEAKARRIIKEHGCGLQVETGRYWRCERCGEELEEQFTTCWACGAQRPGDIEG